MKIAEIRGKRFDTGMEIGYSIEAKVETDIGTVYVHVDEGYERDYSVTRESTFDAMIGACEYKEPTYVMRFDKLSDAKETGFGKIFEALVMVLNCMSA